MTADSTLRSRPNRLAPFAAAWIVAAAAVVGSLVWSALSVNNLERDREAALVELVIRNAIADVSHVQESSTYWDDSLVNVTRRPVDLEWLDANLGEWFAEYAGFDEVYIVDGGGQSIYAMRDGKRAEASLYAEVAQTLAPIIKAALAETEPQPAPELDVAMMTPGVADIVIVRGRVSIVSAKPFRSDSGDLDGHPGERSVHVSIQRLDDTFLRGIMREYGISGAHIEPRRDIASGEVALPLKDRTGRTLAYLVWSPFVPGSTVLTSAGPFLIAMLLVLGGALSVLAYQLRGATRELAASERQAQHRAMHDELTGLPNRAAFEARLWSALASKNRQERAITLLYVDIDHFKQVNDQFGHPVGDRLLSEVAERLTSALRPGDAVFRIGGDEFAIILKHTVDASEVDTICRRIVDWMRQPFPIDDAVVHVGASIGVARASLPSHDADEVARMADVALYRAKSQGRGRYVHHDESMDEAVASRAEFTRDIRAALDEDPDALGGQLDVAYQPIFRVSDSQPVAVEALLRWNHPERGLLTPHHFADLAEESGTIASLGDWVLKRALSDAAGWPGIRLAINVSPSQLAAVNFYENVLSALEQAGFPANRLEFDLTEASLLSARGPVAQTVARLRSAGVTVALDDFGTGFSSLSHIRDVAVDRVKIDRAFIAAADTTQGQSLVQAIVTMAGGYGLRVTAEGIEEPWQEQLASTLGCDEMQGYRLAEPMPASQIAAFLADPIGQRPCRDGSQVA